MTRKKSILIVEDEAAILRGLVDVFVFHGYDVTASSDGVDAANRALAGQYDLILLDVMLPGKDGFTICNEIRARDRDQPIIMLTAKTSDEDIVTGLSLGADDYVAKPFSIQQLILRVEAVLRRSQRLKREEAVFAVGDLRIDTLTLKGTSISRPDTAAIEFTRREVEILLFLLSHRDRPVSRGELLEMVWDYRRTANLDTRTVDIHIAKLRRKIEADAKNPVLLVTVRGEGYQLLGSDKES